MNQESEPVHENPAASEGSQAPDTAAETPPEKPRRRSLRSRLARFFFPPADAPLWKRALPYAFLGFVTLLLLTGGTYAWDYTNSPVFCGTSCHTMPPEYASYQISPHARVDCVECHIGRGFVATRISRKAGDIKHVVALAFRTYEYPIRAGELRPARDTCERCHFPAKFSDDSLRRNISFLEDEENTQIATYLAMRTGGGTRREGLGFGIHWHVENEVWFVATDELEQDIPYVRTVGPDGDETVYVALDSELSREELEAMPEQRMDCITCHNRITHSILPPGDAMDRALSTRQISVEIPFIRREGVRVLSESYESVEEAAAAIRELDEFYAEEYPDFYDENEALIDEAIDMLVSIYEDSNFPAQEVSWTTHPNNLGHINSPGCFRCHDGQHASEEDQVIRLECNLCHSIPEVALPGVIEPMLPLATGNQPPSHFSTLWINQHRFAFDQTCQACHTVEDPGGTSNTSFCSNSACHGTAWEYAELDAPGISELLPAEPEPTEEPAAEAPAEGDELTFEQIAPLFEATCLTCHNASVATGGLVLETYNEVMTGGNNGPAILPGDAEDSLLVQRQREGHFGQLSDDDLELVIRWIEGGAPEN